MGHLYIDAEPTYDSIVQFMRNRLARVAPLYLLLVAASYALTMTNASPWPLYPVDNDNIARHVLFIKGDSVLWTVAVEMQFYALFVILWLVAARSRQTLIMLMLLYVAILSLAAYPREPLILRSLPFFAAGIMVHFWRPAASLRNSNLLFVICLCAVIMSYPRLAGPIKFHLSLASAATEFPRVWEQTAYLILVPALLWLSMAAPLASSVFGSSIARHLGNVSYSAYLLHMPVLYIVGSVPGMRENTGVFLMGFLVVTFAVSTASRVWLERPLENLVRRSRIKARAFAGLPPPAASPSRRPKEPG